MGREKILVIEDNVMLAETYVDLLQHSGYEVLDVVATGEAALRAASRGRPDLVLMDISLTGPMDGIETYEMIQEKLDVPVIFISGLSDERSRDRMQQVPNHRFLMKPVDFSELEQVIAELLKP
jgi:DNA-binding response OmpR family regulator